MSNLMLNLAAVTLAGLAGCASVSDNTTGDANSEPTSEVVLMSDVEWGPLNPARGDKGPKAATLWGDRTGPGPSGFLVEFLDGFQSPPHIHNVSYRGVVISGLAHNDDPDADEMWMPSGSYWTQPKGAVHITAARGARNLAYIEIEEGPYLVRPVEQEFDSGEVPINVDASNLVWLDQPGTPVTVRGPRVSYLWGEPHGDQWNGSFIELPAGFTGVLRSQGSSLRAVVIQGRPGLVVPGGTDVETLEPGSAFSSTGASVQQISCEAGEGCLLYLRMQGRFEVTPAEPAS